MAYEKNYEALLDSLKKVDAHSRQLMKGMYRREIENKYLREVIANLFHNSKTLSGSERAVLLHTLQHDPWREVEKEFEGLRVAVKSKLGMKTIVGEK
jgi:hypothetical protein